MFNKVGHWCNRGQFKFSYTTMQGPLSEHSEFQEITPTFVKNAREISNSYFGWPKWCWKKAKIFGRISTLKDTNVVIDKRKNGICHTGRLEINETPVTSSISYCDVTLTPFLRTLSRDNGVANQDDSAWRTCWAGRDLKCGITWVNRQESHKRSVHRIHGCRNVRWVLFIER